MSSDNNVNVWANPPSSQAELDALEKRNALLVKWEKAKQDLERAKEDEMDLRKQVAAAYFPNPEKGVNNVDLGNKYTLKMTHKLNYKLNDDNDAIEKALDKIERTGNEGKFIAERLISWKASLSMTEYNQLDPKYKKIIDEVITITEAAPSLEIKEPKVKK